MQKIIERKTTDTMSAATVSGKPEVLPGGARRLPRPSLKNPRSPSNGHLDRDDPDRPLSQQEWTLAWEYCVDFNKTAAMIRAGYAAGSARQNTTRLFGKPNVQAGIVRALEYRQSACMVHSNMVIGSLVAVLESSLGDYITWKDNKISLKPLHEITPEKIKLLAHLETTPLGGISIKLMDKMAAIDKLMIHLGMKDKDGRAKKKPHDLTVEKLQAVRNGDITPTDAALDLEMAGLAVPEILRLMVVREKESDGTKDDGSYSPVSEEEMEARRKAKLAAIEDQKATFLPERHGEVRDLKAELGQGSFDPQDKGGEV